MYSFIIRTDRVNKDGKHPVAIRVVKGGKRLRINLGITADKDYWDPAQERFVIEKGLKSAKAKELNKERKNNNDLLERFNQRAKAVIEQFENDKIDWTLNQFKDALLSKAKQGNFCLYTKELIDIMLETDHVGNATCYQRTLSMMEQFDSKLSERVFSEIDIKYVKKYDIFLQKRGNVGNSRRIHFKTLRAILNKAIQDKEATEHTYPFGKGGFNVAALGEETEKRYLPNEYLEKLKTTSSVRPVNEYARNLFLLSYYCYGISFVDLAHLKSKNIIHLNSGNYIVYKREKTKNKRNSKPIQIKMTAEIDTLIEKLKAFKEPLNDYLLPIVTIDHQGEKLYTHIRNKTKRYNEYLKDLAVEFGIEFNLTSYVSRHTMAMQLQSNAIPREVISQIMGHQDLQTTNTYLDSLDSSVIDEASKVL